jgi:hypothetical protein
MLRRSALISLFALLTLPLTPGGAVAQAPKADPKVQALIDSISAAYKALGSYQVKVTFKYLPDNHTFFRAGQPLSMELKLQKPNKLNITYSLRAAEGASVRTVKRQIVCDGSNVFRWDGGTNTYTKSKAGPVFPDVPGELNLPELELLLKATDPFKNLPVPANLLTIGPPAKVGNVDLDVIEGRISEPRLTFVGKLRVLVSQKDHTFRGVQFDGEGKDPIEGKPLNFRVEAVYDLVTVSPTLGATDFTFSPPAGSREEQPTVKSSGD